MLNSQGYQKDGMREHAVEQYVSRKVPKKYGISICTLRGDNLVHSKGNWLVQDCPTPLPSAVVSPPPPPLPTATMEHLQKALVLTTFYRS